MTYNEFIEACKLKNPNPSQKHHIIPVCMGGTNSKENLIKLSYEDHYEAHRLLALENPDNEAIVDGFTRMSDLNSFVQRCEALRQMGLQHPTEETKKRMSESGKGTKKPAHTEEWKKQISEKLKGIPKSEETKKRMREAAKDKKGTTTGRHWYNNGEISVLREECPDGFAEGRIYKRKEKNA